MTKLSQSQIVQLEINMRIALQKIGLNKGDMLKINMGWSPGIAIVCKSKTFKEEDHAIYLDLIVFDKTNRARYCREFLLQRDNFEIIMRGS